MASTVDEIRGAGGVREPVLAVLLDMINSPHWHPHVAPENWKLLAHSDSAPDDSRPLARCLKDTDLMDAITTAGNPDAIVLSSKILLLNADNYLVMIEMELNEGAWATAPAAVTLKERIDSHKAAIEFSKSVKRGR